MSSTVTRQAIPTTDGLDDVLQQALVDLIDLSLLAKQVHWNISGSRFLQLHHQLDDLAAAAREHVDNIAERAAATGAQPDGRSATIAASSRLPHLKSGMLRDDAAIELFEEVLSAAATGLREAIKATADDPISQDLLIAAGHTVELQGWLLRSQR